MSRVPSVDLALFLSKREEDKQAFVHQIGAAFSDIGFVALSGHFLDQELIDQLYTQVKAFFDLEETTKKNMRLKVLEVNEDIPLLEKNQPRGLKQEI
jgi:isopenicillin N synthase-like dioxygenase